MVIAWYGNKRRACEIVNLVARVHRDGEWMGAFLSDADKEGDEPLELDTHPVGLQRFTTIEVIPSGDAISMDLRHRCHPGWISVTNIPETALP